jgi:hypothetical protein
MGISLPGFFISSAAVGTASNPIYAKKMIAAPWNTPAYPYGKKGDQLAGFTYQTAVNMKKSTTNTLKATPLLLTVAVSLTPM